MGEERSAGCALAFQLGRPGCSASKAEQLVAPFERENQPGPCRRVDVLVRWLHCRRQNQPLFFLASASHTSRSSTPSRLHLFCFVSCTAAASLPAFLRPAVASWLLYKRHISLHSSAPLFLDHLQPPTLSKSPRLFPSTFCPHLARIFFFFAFHPVPTCGAQLRYCSTSAVADRGR